uniref:Uncharacterized protein n=1 Tax=Anguilla anguilla TaxID=7936 RepID=A0A0E9QZD0_ANGAN
MVNLHTVYDILSTLWGGGTVEYISYILVI